MSLTASKLYNYLQCPHRVWRDVWGPKEEKIKEANPFVQLLWDRGVWHENKVAGRLGEFTDLSKIGFDQAADLTLTAMARGDELIYQGVLKGENLMGIPDLLRKQPDGSYLPLDIKAGMGYEGADERGEGRLKKHYAAQLCVYAELLKEQGLRERASTFQPDFLVMFKNGKLGIYDTKASGFQEEDNKLKAEALQRYISEENQKKKKELLIGGIVIKQGKHFLINSDGIYASFGRDKDRVEEKQASYNKSKVKNKGWQYLEF